MPLDQEFSHGPALRLRLRPGQPALLFPPGNLTACPLQAIRNQLSRNFA